MKKTLWKGALSIAILGFLSMPPTASAAQSNSLVGFVLAGLRSTILKDGGYIPPVGLQAPTVSPGTKTPKVTDRQR